MSYLNDTSRPASGDLHEGMTDMLDGRNGRHRGEFLIALDIERMLEAAGVRHRCIARSPSEAASCRTVQAFDLAIVELVDREALELALSGDLGRPAVGDHCERRGSDSDSRGAARYAQAVHLTRSLVAACRALDRLA